MNKRQRKKNEKKIKIRIIEHLEVIKNNGKVILGDNKYMNAKSFEYFMDSLKDYIKDMR